MTKSIIEDLLNGKDFFTWLEFETIEECFDVEDNGMSSRYPTMHWFSVNTFEDSYQIYVR